MKQRAKAIEVCSDKPTIFLPGKSSNWLAAPEVQSISVERRRPGRVDYSGTGLINLLRQSAVHREGDRSCLSSDASDQASVAINPVNRSARGRDDGLVVLNAPAPTVRIAKRGFDLLFAALFLAGLSSLMLAVAWIIRRDGKPAIYRHKRLGAGGQPFYCLKFRSMVADSDRILAEILARDPVMREEWEATQKLRRDPRITPVGRFLRKTSLDELPQLLNVLRGEMSLVGPRPIVASETRFYGEYIEDYYAARPGVTGLWQISGRSDTTYQRRVELDVLYVRNWTFWGDIVILAKTLPAVLLRRGAA